MRRHKPLGVITRGTTNPNRLRRVDSWIVWKYGNALRNFQDPIVVDLGYGASAITTLELSMRIRHIAPRTTVIGLEIDRERVVAAKSFENQHVQFREGGFELAQIDQPLVVRVFNVLRQYKEAEVQDAWAEMSKRLHPDGVIVDGTCDELGRLAAWVEIFKAGPNSLTISVRLKDLIDPIEVAERLPKVLIHHNAPGNAIYDFFQDLAHAWRSSAGVGVFGSEQRWRATVEEMRKDWPILSPRKRDRLGEITVEWNAIAPN